MPATLPLSQLNVRYRCHALTKSELLAMEIYKEPVRIGDTDIEASEAVALGMAKVIASAVAASL